MMDDSCARREWDWNHEYGLTQMTADMIDKLSQRFQRNGSI